MSGKRVQFAGGLRIGTRCETVDEFIEKFYRFCDGSQIFIPHAKRQLGVDTAFSFDLKDGRAALAGLGVVLDAFADSDNRYGRPGIVVEVTQLQSSCRSVLEQMSTMRRTKRPSSTPSDASGGRPTPTPTPVSLRTLSAVPGHRPRAVTAAIELDSAIAIAERTAAARSGGLPATAIELPKAALPVTLPGVSPALPAVSPRLSPPSPSMSAPLPGVSPAVPRVSRPLPGVSPLPAPLPAPPAAPQPVASPAASPAIASPAVASSANDDSGIVEQVSWEASKGFDVPSGPVRTYGEHFGFASTVLALPTTNAAPQRRAQRWIAAAKRLGGTAFARGKQLARTALTRGQHYARNGAAKWRALTPKRRRLVGAGAGAGVLLLVIIIVATGGTTHEPVPPLPPAFIAAGTPAPVVEPPKVEPAKKPETKKKRVKKRVSAKKKTPAKKPVAKPTTKSRKK